MSDIIIYNDGELELNVSVDDETVWLNRSQISNLLDRDVKTIGKHISNVFKEKELEKNSTIANFATVQKEGGREVTRDVEYYNLDVVISVGYRVKSQKGVQFRKWATSVLKSYIQKGYSVNDSKLTQQKFENLEFDIFELKKKQFHTENKIENILNTIKSNDLKPKQGIFYDGQVYDAYVFVTDLIKSAKESIVLIDNYIDESVLTMLSKREKDVSATIHTKNITKQLKLDLEKHNAQYPNIEINKFDSSHDRFLILDDKEIYHIGASLKDLGKKWFAFSLLDVGSFEIINKLNVYKFYNT